MSTKRKIYLASLACGILILCGVAYRSTIQNPAEFYILTYHDVLPSGGTSQSDTSITQDVFEKEILYLLSRGYKIESLGTILDRCEHSGLHGQKHVAITFDDSLKGQYTYALPLLQKYSISASFFIWSDVVGQQGRLSWEDIRQLDQSGMTLGGHTLSHPDLSHITSAQKKHEIFDNKALIESKLNKKINSFSYPFNSLPLEAINTVKQSGYAYARTSIPGTNTCTDSTYTLKSYVLDSSFSTFMSWF